MLGMLTCTVGHFFMYIFTHHLLLCSGNHKLEQVRDVSWINPSNSNCFIYETELII